MHLSIFIVINNSDFLRYLAENGKQKRGEVLWRIHMYLEGKINFHNYKQCQTSEK